jgi:hypothetical protein
MAGLSASYRNSATPRMATTRGEAKTFKNFLGFEQSLWQRKASPFLAVPKTSVLGNCLPPLTSGKISRSVSDQRTFSQRLSTNDLHNPFGRLYHLNRLP